MYFGLVLPPSGLKFTFFKYLFSSMITFVFIYFYLSHSCMCGGRGGLRENWPCCTVIGEDVKLFKKILKLFLFFFSCIFKF